MPRLSKDLRNLSSIFNDNIKKCIASESEFSDFHLKSQYFPNGASVKTKHRKITKFTPFSWKLKELEQILNHYSVKQHVFCWERQEKA